MDAVNFGYTYIDRTSGGGVQNETLVPFSTFEGCCAAAETAANAGHSGCSGWIQIVYCRYDDEHCIPEMQPVLKTFARAGSL
jgi:hypothetical protein